MTDEAEDLKAWLEGKLVLFYLASSPPALANGVLLENVHIERRGARVLCLGRVPYIRDSDWMANLQGAVAWESVMHVVLFDSREDFKKRSIASESGLWSRLKG